MRKNGLWAGCHCDMWERIVLDLDFRFSIKKFRLGIGIRLGLVWGTVGETGCGVGVRFLYGDAVRV